MPYVGQKPADIISTAVDTVTGAFSGAVTVDGAAILNGGIDVAGDITLDADGGDIIFKDGGTEFGRIENQGGDTAIYSTASGHEGLLLGNGAIVPTDNAGSATDNACNLGGATGRFSDFYLAGGVFLGGTGSANQISDYEEGTYTPTITSATNSITNKSATGSYTKVGRLVNVQVNILITTNGNGSGTVRATLPFSTSSNFISYAHGRETAAVGFALTGTVSGDLIAIVKTENDTYPGADSHRLQLSATYTT